MELLKNEVPFVLIDRYFPEVEASHVAIDNYKASYSAIEHLVQNGYTKIGLVTFNSTLFTLQERKRGYINALIDHGLPADISLIKEVDISKQQEEIENALQELCRSTDRVEAVLFASNVLSTAGLKFINRHQVKVPDDLAIVSFDESDASSIFYAPLTHIKQPLYEMGCQVTQILLDTINNNKTITRLNLEAELIIGKSSLHH
jgi:LacI family transcriptional regulator